jgi:vanillate O-demethylase monooxygenase subunit
MQADMNYFFIQENVLDLTHFGFVHADLMDQVGWNDGDLQTIVKDNTVTFRKEFDGAPLPPFVSLALGMDPATNVKRVDWGTMVNPGTHTAGIEFRHDGAKTFWGSEDLSWRIAHMTTPITHNRCHYWWRTGYSFGNVDDNMLQSIRATLIRAFNQDKDLLEKVQYLIDHDSRGIHSTEVSFRADRPALRARAILMKMLSTERKKTA